MPTRGIKGETAVARWQLHRIYGRQYFQETTIRKTGSEIIPAAWASWQLVPETLACVLRQDHLHRWIWYSDEYRDNIEVPLQSQRFDTEWRKILRISFENLVRGFRKNLFRFHISNLYPTRYTAGISRKKHNRSPSRLIAPSVQLYAERKSSQPFWNNLVGERIPQYSLEGKTFTPPRKNLHRPDTIFKGGNQT